MPDEGQPGRAIRSRLGSIVLGEHPANDLIIDLNAKGVGDILRDAGTAKAGITTFDLYNRIDEFVRRSLRPEALLTSRREEQSIRYLRFLRAAWNLHKVLGYTMIAGLGILPNGTNSVTRPTRRQSNECKFGARRRPRLTTGA
jgi:hypothetical protein